MIRSAFEILGWYLSPRRLPWFAVAEFAIMIGAIVAYETTGANGWIITASLATFFGTYFAADFYADLGRHPATKRERERQERRIAEWYASLSERDKAKVRALGENVANVARLGRTGISFNEAAAVLRRFN